MRQRGSGPDKGPSAWITAERAGEEVWLIAHILTAAKSAGWSGTTGRALRAGAPLLTQGALPVSSVSRALLAIFGLALTGCVVNSRPSGTTSVVVQPDKTPRPIGVAPTPPERLERVD